MKKITHKEFFRLLEGKDVALMGAGKLQSHLQSIEALKEDLQKHGRHYKANKGINSGILHNTSGSRFYRQIEDSERSYGDLQGQEVFIYDGFIALIKEVEKILYVTLYRLSGEQPEGIPLF